MTYFDTAIGNLLLLLKYTFYVTENQVQYP